MGGPFRIGLVGAGRMGRTHLRALASSEQVAVTAIAEPSAAARDLAGGTQIAVHRDVAELLKAGGIDAVLVAAPTDRHLEIVEAVAAAGLPILCEKPCGISVAETERAAAASRRHGVPLQVAYWRRYVPALVRLREQIADGELGDVHFVACFQWDATPPAAAFRIHSGGIFRDMGVHEFDQMRWLTGQDVARVVAVASPLGVDATTRDRDSAQALTSLSGGTVGLVSLGRHFPGGDMARVEVFGARDAVRVDFLDPQDGEAVQLDALRRQADAFAELARGGPLTGASTEDAARALAAATDASAQIDTDLDQREDAANPQHPIDEGATGVWRLTKTEHR
jgi:myo-inositol 2-dehydrogenase/D-chiro-inositol 1-dehydrogenase